MIGNHKLAKQWMPVLLLVAPLAGAPGLTAAPPAMVNYQGVLRDASGAPVTASLDMIFRLYDAPAAGNEILVDRHLAGLTGDVEVAGGLFNVVLGGGTVEDGAGTGAYATLADVFRDFAEVYLAVEIETSMGFETLAPRTRIVSAAYALSADHASTADLATDATHAAHASTADSATNADHATSATNATNAAHASTADSAMNADHATSATNATNAVHASTADSAMNADHATSATDATDASNLGGMPPGAFLNTSATTQVKQGKLVVGQASGTAQAYGLEAYGSEAGGYFRNPGGSSSARVGTLTEGIYAVGTWIGLHGWGNSYGGFFRTLGSGEAHVAHGEYGVSAYGNFAGGYFEDLNSSGNAYVGWGDYGVRGFGDFAGGLFDDLDSSSYGRVGYDTYKIQGSGTVSFVQNHPDERDKVVVYHAPEASEVAVYTRGVARLTEGEAVVALDPTFRWVTNPDLGLTAHLTPRGAACLFFVESVSTAELAVRSDDPACSGAAFDYMVWGLRIGFEGSTPVQPKEREAFIPSMATHRKLVTAEPELGAYTARSRFETIARETTGVEKVSFSRAEDLVRRIHEFDPEVDELPEREAAQRPEPAPEIATLAAAGTRRRDPGPPRASEAQGASSAAIAEALPTEPVAASAVDLPPGAVWFEAVEEVAGGDVLVLDREAAGRLRKGASQADPGVVGVAAGALRTKEGGSFEAAVFASGVASVKADAGYGAILAGDLLVTSPTPGHAMRAENALSGTVVGKALESLDTGTATIRVLVMPR